MAFSNVIYELEQTGQRVQEILNAAEDVLLDKKKLELSDEQVEDLKAALDIQENTAILDDETVSEDSTWSSEKINDEVLRAMRYEPVKLLDMVSIPSVLDRLGDNDWIMEFYFTPDTPATLHGEYPMGEGQVTGFESDRFTSGTVFIFGDASDWVKDNMSSVPVTAAISDGITSSTMTKNIPFGYKRRIGAAPMPTAAVNARWVQDNLPVTNNAISGRGPSFSVTAGEGEYVWFCVYKESPGATTFTFKDVKSGFVGGFHRHENVSDDCPYVVYVSDNPNLGSVTIQPQ